MSLVPRNSLFDLDHFFENTWVPFQASRFAPRVDVKERGDAIEISVELPGVDKNDIHVSLHNGVLSLEAETKQVDKEEKDGKLIRQERRYGKYSRSFDLGPQVHETDVTASYENGVLTLTAPKVKPEEQQSRRIDIR